jgi:deoxyribose-phosphate aldolase
MTKSILSIAGVIDHSLLHPTMTDKVLADGCRFALENRLAAVCVKPYALKMAVEIVAGSDVAAGTVVGFPHGSNTIAIKVHEAELACSDGATELDAVVNVGKVLSGDWDYVEEEIGTLNEAAVAGGAVLKVIFENDFLENDALKIKLCEICSDISVAFVKTSTGYGFVKRTEGGYGYDGATEHDLKLMRNVCPPEIQVKAAGGIRTLDDLLRVLDLGVTRVGISASEAILNEARQRGYE